MQYNILSTIEKIIESTYQEDEVFLFDVKNKSNRKSKIPARYIKAIKLIQPEYIYIHDEKIVALFFSGEMNSEQHTQIRNMGGVPMIYYIKEDQIDIHDHRPHTTIYNGFDFDTTKKEFENITDKSISLLDLITGQKSLPPRKNNVNKELLNNLQATFEDLKKNGLDDTIAQGLIGRLLFSRFLIDNGIVLEGLCTNKDDLLTLIQDKDQLYIYFETLKETFNGDMFPPEGEKELVEDIHLGILHLLFSGSDVKGNQYSLFDMYDFKIIPVELLSEVYEQFMTSQKDKGAFYTPTFLVDYILTKTIKPHLETNSSCTIFDPSCGSGIFLVESYRLLIQKNLDADGKISSGLLSTLLQDNIFGIDIDSIATNITIFSLYLVMISYVSSDEIGNFKFPHINNTNIFVGDFFDQKNIYNDILKNKSLDFVVGNPPWGAKSELLRALIKSKKQGYIDIGHKEIAQGFIIRLQEIVHTNTKLGLVLPAKMLYNHKAKNFRAYMLNYYKIEELLELSPVRGKIFGNAVAPTVIMIMDVSTPDEEKNNMIIHTSLKPNIFLKQLGLIVIEKNDIKHIQQSYFLKYDYLWKVLLYGNVFDFYLMKRLLEYKNVNTWIEEQKLLSGQGIQVGGGDTNPSGHLMGKSFINTQKKDLKPFFIRNGGEVFNHNTLHRPRNSNLFESSPKILLKKGFETETYKCTSVYTENEYIFTDSITAIVGNQNQKALLKSMCGILGSNLFSYFNICHGASAGVEREQLHNEDDAFMMPIVEDENIAGYVDGLQSFHQQKYTLLSQQALPDLDQINQQIIKTEQTMNSKIFEAFDISEREMALIDYAQDVSIALLNNKPEPIQPVTKETIEKYAQLYIDDYGKMRDGTNRKYFEVDIYMNKYVVGIEFRVATSKRDKQVIYINDKETIKKVFEKLKPGEEQITNDLYRLRDVRGFKKGSFYIIKFNQAKNRHHALAYQDISEFSDAMMKSGLKKISSISDDL